MTVFLHYLPQRKEKQILGLCFTLSEILRCCKVSLLDRYWPHSSLHQSWKSNFSLSSLGMWSSILGSLSMLIFSGLMLEFGIAVESQLTILLMIHEPGSLQFFFSYMAWLWATGRKKVSEICHWQDLGYDCKPLGFQLSIFSEHALSSFLSQNF